MPYDQIRLKLDTIKPLFPFAGSKRNIASDIATFLPSKIAAYAEPFAGSAALLCHLVREHPSWKPDAVKAAGGFAPNLALFDADRDLVDLYAAFQTHGAENILSEARRRVLGLKGNIAAYYDLRDEWNSTGRPRGPGLQLAIRCLVWNGVWRHSKKGIMNVPPTDRVGDHRLPDEGRMAAWEALMAGRTMDGVPAAQIGQWDVRTYETGASDWVRIWTESIRAAQSLGAVVVYLDPPYHAKFTGYLANGFGDEDQARTVRCAADLDAKGFFVVLSNANSSYMRALVKEHWPKARLEALVSKRTIAADKLARVDAPELLALSSR